MKPRCGCFVKRCGLLSRLELHFIAAILFSSQKQMQRCNRPLPHPTPIRTSRTIMSGRKSLARTSASPPPRGGDLKAVPLEKRPELAGNRRLVVGQENLHHRPGGTRSAPAVWTNPRRAIARVGRSSGRGLRRLPARHPGGHGGLGPRGRAQSTLG